MNDSNKSSCNLSVQGIKIMSWSNVETNTHKVFVKVSTLQTCSETSQLFPCKVPLSYNVERTNTSDGGAGAGGFGCEG